MKILIVEDNPRCAYALREYLLSLRPNDACDTVASMAAAKEAIHKAATEGAEYTLVLLDLILPDSDSAGHTLSELRPTFGSTPTIVVSGFSDLPTGLEAIDAGAVDFVCKTELDRLADVVRKVLSPT